MDDAAIERIASAVASKIINQRLTELQAVREQALREGRAAALREAAAIARRKEQHVRDETHLLETLPTAMLSVGRCVMFAAVIREEVSEIGRRLEALAKEAAP